MQDVSGQSRLTADFHWAFDQTDTTSHMEECAARGVGDGEECAARGVGDGDITGRSVEQDGEREVVGSERSAEYGCTAVDVM